MSQRRSMCSAEDHEEEFLNLTVDECVCVSLFGTLRLMQESCNKSSLPEGQTAGSDSTLWLFCTIMLLLSRLLSFVKMEQTPLNRVLSPRNDHTSRINASLKQFQQKLNIKTIMEGGFTAGRL